MTLQQMAQEIALAEGIAPELFARLIMQESSWNPDAGNGKDFPACVGLLQINEAYGKWFINKHGKGVVPLYDRALQEGDAYWTDERVRCTLLDPQANLTIGARELRRLLSYFGDWQSALVAWNWGAGNFAKLEREYPKTWMAHLPAESQWMIAKILLVEGLETYGWPGDE